MIPVTFVILTGGESSRFGANKSEIFFDGTTLLLGLLEKLPAGHVVIVGPSFDQEIRPVQFAREDPIGGGPVAALGAGIQFVRDEFLVLLATDLPFVSSIIPELLKFLPTDLDAIIPVDNSDRLQTLSGIYRTEALLTALNGMASLTGESMRNLVSMLKIQKFPLNAKDASKLLDIDTPQDLIRAVEIRERETRKL